MGFFKGKPKDKDKDRDDKSAKPPTRRSIRTIAPSGTKPAPSRDEPGGSGRTGTIPRPAAPNPGTARQAPSAPAPAQRPAAKEPSAPASAPVRPQTRAPIHASKPADFAGDLASGRRSTGPARTGDAALLEFLQTKVSLLDEGQIQQAKSKANQDSLPIDSAIVQLGFLTEEQMVNALIHECWVPHLKVDRYEIRKKALDTIAREDAVHYGVFPVDKLGQLLTLAMVNPLDSDTIRTLESKTSLDIKKVVATRSEIYSVIEKYYSGSVQAKEGSLSITQDVEPKSVTQMLAGVSAASDKLPHAKSSMPMPSPAPAAMPSDIQDIDDLLSADEAIAPAIVEPISLKAEDIEVVSDVAAPAVEAPATINDFELDDTSAIAPTKTPVPPSRQPAIEPALEPVESSQPSFDFEELLPPAAKTPPPPPKPAPLAPEFEMDSGQPVQETGIVRPKRPPVPAAAQVPQLAPPRTPAAPAAPSAPSSTPTTSSPLPAAARGPAAAPAKPATSRFTSRANATKPGLINLVPVMEEEFQHAITHGKSHVFEKWVGLQTRNRIINAVTVESELDRLLVSLYASPLPAA